MTMNSKRPFTYHARRGAYLTTFGFLFLLMPLELCVTVFLIGILIANPLWRYGLDACLILLGLLILTKLLAPLWTRHHVDQTSFWLAYGLDGRVHLPLTALTGAEPVREYLGFPVARYNALRRRVSLAFSDEGQVLLHLDQAYPLRVGFSRVLAEEILVNVDQREAFLQALKGKGVSPSSPIVSNSQPAATLTISSPALASPISGVRAVEPAIRTSDLQRFYGKYRAVNQLNLAVYPGEIYGFLGANGAGKTTTLKMLVGLLEPSAGRAWIAGHDVWREPLAAKAAFGYVADRALLYERLTGQEFLSFLAQLRGLPERASEQRIASLLALFELTHQAAQLCGTYSFGMKRKLALAGALLHQPPILLLDEPLNGLDPLSMRRLKDLLLELAAGGTTILLSTHDLASAEALCQRIGIMHQGRLLLEGPPADLRQAMKSPDLETLFLELVTKRDEMLHQEVLV